MLDLPALEAKGEGHAAAVEIGQARRRIDAEADDLVGGVGGDFLDIHAALGRGDEADAAGAAIDQQGQIQFALDIAAVLDIDAVDLLAGGTGLVRDQRASQHLAGQFLGLGHGFGQTHAALLAGGGFGEMALAAAAGMDLRLDHPQRAVQLARGRFGLVGLGHDTTVADRRAVMAQQRLGLIFVNVHRDPLIGSADLPVSWHNPGGRRKDFQAALRKTARRPRL